MEPSTPTTPQKLGLRAAETPGSRRRRKIPVKLARGLREPPLPQAATAAKVKKLLKLAFDPADWQIELIHRIQSGYDSIAIAGTGYGNSLVFQGLAALGGKGKAVMVICPLKALEADQVSIPPFFLSFLCPARDSVDGANCFRVHAADDARRSPDGGVPERAPFVAPHALCSREPLRSAFVLW